MKISLTNFVFEKFSNKNEYDILCLNVQLQTRQQQFALLQHTTLQLTQLKTHYTIKRRHIICTRLHCNHLHGVVTI